MGESCSWCSDSTKLVCTKKKGPADRRGNKIPNPEISCSNKHKHTLFCFAGCSLDELQKTADLLKIERASEVLQGMIDEQETQQEQQEPSRRQ